MYRQSQQERPTEKQKGMGMIAFKSCVIWHSIPLGPDIFFFPAVAGFETRSFRWNLVLALEHVLQPQKNKENNLIYHTGEKIELVRYNAHKNTRKTPFYSSSWITIMI